MKKITFNKKFFKLFIFALVLFLVFGSYSTKAEAYAWQNGYWTAGNVTSSQIVCVGATPDAVNLAWANVPGALSYTVARNNGSIFATFNNNVFFGTYTDWDPVPKIQNTYQIQAFAGLNGSGSTIDFVDHTSDIATCPSVSSGTSSTGPFAKTPLTLTSGQSLYVFLTQTEPWSSAPGNMSNCVFSIPSGTPSGTIDSGAVAGGFTPTAIDSSHPFYPSTSGSTYQLSCTRSTGTVVSDSVTVIGASASTPPSPPIISSALPGTCGTGNITVSWGAVTGATLYEIRDGASSVVYSGTNTSFTHSSLADSSSHSYYARVTTASGTSSWSPSSTNATAPAPCSYTVTATAGANGTISPGSRTVTGGNTTTFTVTPNATYTASVSSTCGTGTLVGTTYTTAPVNSNCTVTASFSPSVTNYTVTATAGANGTISPASRTVAAGNTTTFTVTPNATYTASVSSTCGTGTLVGTLYTTAPITSNCTVTASFSIVAGTIPTVDTPTSLAGALTTATLGATVRTLGNPATLTDRGVCYIPDPSINPSLTNGATCVSATLSQTVPGVFTVAVSSLTPSTIYHYRGYATNATGTGYSADASFVTGTSSMTGTLTPASPSCAINSGFATCAINFTWNTLLPVGVSSVTSNTNNSGAASPNFVVANGNSGGPAAFTVPYNTRTFYLYNNGVLLDTKTVTSACSGGTFSGVCVANASPTIDTPTSGSLTPSTAVIGATVRTIGSPAPLTARGVCYSSTTANPSLTNGATCIPATLLQTAPSAFTVNLSSLTASTTYNFRGYATNSTGTGYTANTTFATAAPSAMSGTLLPASSSCTISVGVGSCVSGTLTWTTASPVSTSAITNNGTATLSTGGPLNTLNGSATFTVPYNSALGGVTSFFLFNNSQQLAVATVTTTCAGGSSWNGSICAANAVPTVISPTATGMTTTGATLGANITSAGVPATITARGTCWGANPAPVTNCVAEGGTTTGVFTQARTGMTAGTTYYYRGYATNSTGTGYSADAQFTTTSAAGMTGNLSAPNCTIALSASTCTTTLTWSVSNPEVALGSNVTSNTNNSGAASPNFVIAPPVTTGNADAGTKTLVIIPFGSRTFFLNNNAKSLVPTSPSGGGITVTATCASGSWNGTTCSNVQPAPSVTLVANPLAVATAGMTSSLSWTTSNLANPDYCTSNFFAGNRLVSNLTPVVVTPVAPSSTYTIQCFRLSDSTSTPVSSQVVTVGAGTKKPIFIEN